MSEEEPVDIWLHRYFLEENAGKLIGTQSINSAVGGPQQRQVPVA
jgi:hypothetical protein